MSALGLIRTINEVAAPIHPDWSARLACNTLLRPRNYPPRDWEQPALRGARPVTFRFGLTGLAWGEAGPAVLMLHGWEGRPTQFGALLPGLLAAGRQVIALEGPAHGRSPATESTLMEFSLALREAAVEVPQLESVVGHSLGAAAAAIALSEGLPAERAVLVAPPSAIEDGLNGFAHRLGLNASATRRFLELVESANGVPARDIEVAARARRLDVPALIVHDRGDRAVPFAEGETIAAAWPGASLLVTEGLGHWRPLTDPATVARMTRYLVTGATHSR